MLGNAPGHQTHIFNGRDEDGNPKWLRIGKQFRELPEFVLGEDGFNPLQYVPKKLAGKTSPLVRFGTTVVTGGTEPGGGKYMNKRFKDVEPTLGGWAKAYALAAKDLFIPFSMRTLTDPEKRKDWQPTDIAIPSSKGYSHSKATADTKELLLEYMSVPLNERNPDILTKHFQVLYTNNLNPLVIAKDAKMQIQADARVKLDYYKDEIEDIRQRIANETLTPTEKGVLERRIKVLEREQREMIEFDVNVDGFINDLDVFAESLGLGGENEPMSLDKLYRVIDANQYKDFVQRIIDPENSPVLNKEPGIILTHFMAYGEADGIYYAFPTVMRDPDDPKKLKEYGSNAMNEALNRGEYIKFSNETDAKWFSENYKMYWETPPKK